MAAGISKQEINWFKGTIGTEKNHSVTQHGHMSSQNTKNDNNQGSTSPQINKPIQIFSCKNHQMNSKTDFKKITNFIKELKEFKEDTQGQLHKLK